MTGAGSQYNAFKSLTGNYPKRKGTNPFVDGDYFSIDFDNDDGYVPLSYLLLILLTVHPPTKPRLLSKPMQE